MGHAIVCVGTSWGGLKALRHLVHSLGADFPLPVVLIQHRHRDSDDLLAQLLQDCTPLPVVEVDDKEPVQNGRIYLAPPDYHLLLDDGHFALSMDPPVRFSRPSIDVTFHSAADAYGRQTIGVVLTGANADGAEGLRRIVDVGGVGIIQDPATAQSRTMPAAALSAVPGATVLPLEGIASHLRALVFGDAASRPPRARPAPAAQSGEPGSLRPPEAR